jgi:hypothetical protein
MSQSDMATSKWAPQPAPTTPNIPSSGAKLHDLQKLARSRAQHVLETVRERTKDKPWFLPVAAAGGAFVVLILFAAMIKMAIGSSDSSSTSTSSTSSTSTSARGHDSIIPIPTTPPKPAVVRPMSCKASGGSRTIAPKALIGSGVEVAAVGAQLALGFAVAPKEAALEVLDPGTLASASALHLRANDAIRRVMALDGSRAAVDADRKGDKLQGRRTVRGDSPIDLGAIDGGIAWAPHGSDKGVKLWSLPNPDAPIEALRGEPTSNGFAVAFRQGATIWFGACAGTPPAPISGLSHVDGLGSQVGSPALAVSGDRVMVAWADRTGSDVPWSVRYVAFKPSDGGVQPRSFSPPAGGLGENSMSPGVASLGGGRFLLVWTEGPKSSHQVRAVVLNDGALGDAFTVSAEGVNAGQGQAAVLSDGRGVVAFLASSQTGKGFEVAATPIECTEKN